MSINGYSLRVLGAIAVTVAVSVGFMGGEANASGRAHFILANGIPGTTIDVCIDGVEIASQLHFEDTQPTRTPTEGDHAIRVRISSPGQCDGDVLAALHGKVDAHGEWVLIAGLDQDGRPSIELDWQARSRAVRTGRFQMTFCHLAEAPRLRTFVDGKRYVGIANDVKSYCYFINRISPGRHTIELRVAKTDRPFVAPTTLRFREGWRYSLWVLGTPQAGGSLLLIPFEVGSR